LECGVGRRFALAESKLRFTPHSKVCLKETNHDREKKYSLSTWLLPKIPWRVPGSGIGDLVNDRIVIRSPVQREGRSSHS